MTCAVCHAPFRNWDGKLSSGVEARSKAKRRPELAYTALCVGSSGTGRHAIEKHNTERQSALGIARHVCSTKQPKRQPVQSQAVFVCPMCGCVCKCCWKLNVDFCVVVSWCERRTCVNFQLKSKIRDSFGRFGPLYRAISIKTISLH